MPKVRVKQIKKGVIDDEGLNDIIAQLVGQDRKSENVPNAQIIYEHYCALDSQCLAFINRLMSFRDEFFASAPAYLNRLGERTAAFVSMFLGRYKETFTLNREAYARIEDLALDPTIIDGAVLRHLRDVGYDARESTLCCDIINCAAKHRKAELHKCADGEEMLKKLEKIQANAFCPFEPLFDLDIKYLIQKGGLDKQHKLMVARMLVDITKIGYEIYEIISTPCVEIDSLIDTIMEQFKHFRKEIRGCDEAFKLIENSTDMFKKNFKKYYLQFRQSKNQTNIILESYLADVIGETKSNPKVVRQIKELMFFIRKKLADQQKRSGQTPPQMANMMSMMDNHIAKFSQIFDSLEKDGDGVTEQEMEEGSELVQNLESLLGNMMGGLAGEPGDDEPAVESPNTEHAPVKTSKNARRRERRKKFE